MKSHTLDLSKVALGDFGLNSLQKLIITETKEKLLDQNYISISQLSTNLRNFVAHIPFVAALCTLYRTYINSQKKDRKPTPSQST
jgi:hypothetical protein